MAKDRPITPVLPAPGAWRKNFDGNGYTHRDSGARLEKRGRKWHLRLGEGLSRELSSGTFPCADAALAVLLEARTIVRRALPTDPDRPFTAATSPEYTAAELATLNTMHAAMLKAADCGPQSWVGSLLKPAAVAAFEAIRDLQKAAP